MSGNSAGKYRVLALFLLVAVIAAGSAIAWSQYGGSRLIEISISTPPETEGQVYVSGAVSNPGIYPFESKDTISDVLQFAGGVTGNAEEGRVNLYVPVSETTPQPQRVNINRAEAWLLEALPGIGETLARRIIDYRQQNGQFKQTSELLKVEGIGTATYERIKDLLAVADE